MKILKALINEDHDAIVDSVAKILADFDIGQIDHTHYCDEAFLKVKMAELENNKYDLLVTDLSFKQDHRNVTFSSGEELIRRLREDHPELLIIVYSMKDQIQKVRNLINKHKVNAYVCKDRNGSKELAKAIKAVQKGNLFLSPQVEKALQPKSKLEIDDFDVLLINLLARGLSQDEISEDLKVQDIKPNSLSTIEKRLNKLKIQFRAQNTIHLVAITKDLGLI